MEPPSLTGRSVIPSVGGEAAAVRIEAGAFTGRLDGGVELRVHASARESPDRHLAQMAASCLTMVRRP